MVWFVAWRSWDFHQTLLQVWVVLLVYWVEFLNVELFQDVFDKELGLYHLLDVGIFGLGLVCIFLAVGDTVCYFEKFFGYFGDSKTFAFLYLPE